MKLLFDDAENVEKHLLKGLFFRKIEAPPLKSIKQSFSKTEINTVKPVTLPALEYNTPSNTTRTIRVQNRSITRPQILPAFAQYMAFVGQKLPIFK